MPLAPSISWLSAVEDSHDYRRIKSLPLRQWGQDESFVGDLTQYLRVPGSTAELRPIQASALEELHDINGLFGAIRVGGGKTLISLLAPVIVGAQRPLLLIPASLRDKTRRDARAYAKDWYIARNLRVLSYEKLSVLSGLRVLDEIRPDLIIMDECHKVKDTRRPRARRLKRYLSLFPECHVMAMSGTITSRSLREYWHIIKWCLPKTCPLPYSFNEFVAWCEALDQTKGPSRHPGVLVDLHPDASGTTPLLKARDAYARRLADTPGVIVSRDKGPGMGLVIRAIKPPFNRAVIEPAIRRLREDWCVPDGEPFETAIELWRHVREVTCGLYYKWDPQPPNEWREARLAWSRFCRYAIYQLRRNLDSPAQVSHEIETGQLDDGGVWQTWKDIRGTFTPNTVAVWIDDSLVNFAAAWLEEHKGLCWVEHRAFAEKLERVSGVPFFANGGLDMRKRPIEAHTGPAIVSREANSTGRNLQAWHKNLVVSHVPNGKLWEQTIGRTHREGQRADEVIFEIPTISLEQYNELCKALNDARYIEETTRQPQKLCYATRDIPDLDEVALRAEKDYLWRAV